MFVFKMMMTILAVCISILFAFGTYIGVKFLYYYTKECFEDNGWIKNEN